MDDLDFQKLVVTITGGHTPRVWSLLVTVFGELAQEDDSRISGAVLNRLTEAIGIKPEALRVALHRLRKDGWIQSVKSGRNSHYFLGGVGKAESAKANPAIYLQRPLPNEIWIALHQGSITDEESNQGEVCIRTGFSLSLKPLDRPEALCLPVGAEEALPDWIRERVCSQDLVDQAKSLDQRLSILSKALRTADKMDPFQTAVLRILIIHEWRRVILKVPHLPARHFPDGWRGDACQTLIKELLDILAYQGIDAIEGELAA